MNIRFGDKKRRVWRWKAEQGMSEMMRWLKMKPMVMVEEKWEVWLVGKDWKGADEGRRGDGLGSGRRGRVLALFDKEGQNINGALSTEQLEY